MLKVEPIQNGVVIDHIPAGRGMEIYRLLHLESKHQGLRCCNLCAVRNMEQKI